MVGLLISVSLGGGGDESLVLTWWWQNGLLTFLGIAVEHDYLRERNNPEL